MELRQLQSLSQPPVSGKTQAGSFLCKQTRKAVAFTIGVED